MQNANKSKDENYTELTGIINKEPEEGNITNRLMTVDQINETRKLSPLIEAPSPVQFDTDLSSKKVPITAPGQIASETTMGEWAAPSGWSGAMNYDGGSKIKSIGGYGRDYFLMDCPAGLPYGITVQKGSEFGYMEVYITGSERDTEFGEHEKTYEPYGIISISGICP